MLKSGQDVMVPVQLLESDIIGQHNLAVASPELQPTLAMWIHIQLNVQPGRDAAKRGLEIRRMLFNFSAKF
jgi:hypothetical protein